MYCPTVPTIGSFKRVDGHDGVSTEAESKSSEFTGLANPRLLALPGIRLRGALHVIGCTLPIWVPVASKRGSNLG
jgi:hypothetical protein